MARIRTIKPEFFHDKGLASCSPHARLLAIALLQLADCEGRMKNIPMQIHAHAFPWEAEVNTPMLLSELESIGFVILYESEGDDYIAIPNFLKHQRLQGKEAHLESKVPPQPATAVENKGGHKKGINGEYTNDSQGMTGTGEQGNRGIGTENIPREKTGVVSTRNPVPFVEIINRWNSFAETHQLPQCVKRTKKIEGHIRQRWLEDLPEIGDWENYLDYIGQSRFLTGRVTNGDKRPFRATLEWITNPTNYGKIAAGQYHGQ